jgi:hypothetical protein
MMDTTNNIGSIQSAQSNVSNLPLCLNPIGGNVGINTSNPLTTLHVNGSTFLSKATFIGPNYGISATNGGNAIVSSTQLFVSGGSFNNNSIASVDGGQFIIADNTQTKYRLGFGIDLTNSVGIIEAAISGSGYIPLSLNGHGGNVGINVTSPQYTLDINGTFYCNSTGTVNGAFTANNGIINNGTLTTGVITTTGSALIKSPGVYNNTATTGSGRQVYITSLGTFNSQSSARDTKENIVPINISDSSVIYKFKGYTYSYIGDESNTMRVGYMADEINELDKKLVYDNDGKPDAVYYSDMVVYAIQEIQKLKSQIDTLTETVSILTKKN